MRTCSSWLPIGLVGAAPAGARRRGEFDNGAPRLSSSAATGGTGERDAAGLRRTQRRAAAPLAPGRPRRAGASSTATARATSTCRAPAPAGSAAASSRSTCPATCRARSAPATRTTASVVDFPHIGPVDASDARRITLEMAGILLAHGARAAGRDPGLPERRRDRGGRGGGRDGGDPPPRGRRGDRPGPRRARGAPRRGPALARAGLVAAERLRRRHPVPLPRRPRRGAGPDRGRQGAGRAPATGSASSSTCRTSTPPASATSRRSATSRWSPPIRTRTRIAPASRNLTDAQLDAIAESGGVVGLNYAVGFLRDDGRRVAGHRADGADPPPRPPARAARRGRAWRSAPTSTAR